MLKKWTVQNFKSIYEETTIDLAPLTIFAGANSSGKSTVIQSILLAAQTIQSPVRFRPIVLNGHILRLGAYDDIVSNSRERDDITFGFELSAPLQMDYGEDLPHYGNPFFSYSGYELIEKATSIECKFSFNARGSIEEMEALQLQPRLEKTYLKVNPKAQLGLFDDADSDALESEYQIARYQDSIRDRIVKLRLTETPAMGPALASLDYEFTKPSYYKNNKRYFGADMPSTAQIAGATFAHFLPANMSVVFDVIDEKARRIIEFILNPREGRYAEADLEVEWINLDISVRNKLIEYIEECTSSLRQGSYFRLFSALDALKQTFSQRNYQHLISTLPNQSLQLYRSNVIESTPILVQWIKGAKESKYQLTFVPIQGVADAAIDYIKLYFSSKVKYLGPLRDEPKPVYPLAGASDPRDVGFKGEHTAAVLDIHKYTTVQYISSKSFSENKFSGKQTRGTLIEAISDWLNYLGVVNNVVTVDRGKLGHELKVSTSPAGELHDLTHVGVGVSQVLPILVMSLLAPLDSTLIFEQPELHLHPKVQTRLADFFFSMTHLYKQCIVETHSEYLINRLRYIAVVDETGSASDKSVVYFVEKREGHSNYCPLKINEFGVIANWPVGFFDESEETSTALLKAALEKRSNKRLRKIDV